MVFLGWCSLCWLHENYRLQVCHLRSVYLKWLIIRMKIRWSWAVFGFFTGIAHGMTLFVMVPPVITNVFSEGGYYETIIYFLSFRSFYDGTCCM